LVEPSRHVPADALTLRADHCLVLVRVRRVSVDPVPAVPALEEERVVSPVTIRTPEDGPGLAEGVRDHRPLDPQPGGLLPDGAGGPPWEGGVDLVETPPGDIEDSKHIHLFVRPEPPLQHAELQLPLHF